jgi:mannose-6-phosphate isomerase
MLYPLTFRPIYKERVWGGRRIESLYGKELPANVPIGESWEISDRPGDVSVVDNGPLMGRDLNWIVRNHQSELLGGVQPLKGRFPLLVKILDAQEKLSLQVHPPRQVAAELGGEPKTELWYMAGAAPGAELYVGLARGITRELFERKLSDGTVADCFHRVPVRAGEAMFVPSGRVHAIGAGCVIFEIQQNSDTTYRVFDWNRVGLDGKPRELHIEESLASVDFNDFEPGLIATEYSGPAGDQARLLVTCPHFEVTSRCIGKGKRLELGGRALVLGITEGDLDVVCGAEKTPLKAGGFCLLPASLNRTHIETKEFSRFLLIEPKQGLLE